jgi:hypothetical protein
VAEDESGLTPAEDDNAALRKIDRNMPRRRLVNGSIKISRAANDGYTRFLCGFISTAELCFAEAVAEIKKENQNIVLENISEHKNRFQYATLQAERIIAVYDRRDKGNTEAVLRKAMELQRDIYIIFHN